MNHKLRNVFSHIKETIIQLCEQKYGFQPNQVDYKDETR